MRWFKHLSTASDDLFIKDLENEFGDTGYAFWFKMHELFAKHGETGTLTISWTNVLQALGKKRPTVERLLTRCVSAGKWRMTDNGTTIILQSTKFAEFADNYTKYGKELQRDFKDTSKQEVEGEVEVEQKKIQREREHTHAPRMRHAQQGKATPESLEEVTALFTERQYLNPRHEAEKFWNHYSANGWKVGRNPMKDWKAAAANWNKNAKEWSNGTRRSSDQQNAVTPKPGKYSNVG